ncbi:hypothetical protein [Asticcacaulis sp. 201]|uniref:hypothetical protein n=1 Tax=Asticcacaulis sp. 201 TaxID=3028787 RepID=UPI00291675DE|nr:hypothetical protein [Asticcacaulis sp. 201]MDV6329770.1 hypothetical protein [Asticcacaulis sp. 201]
MKRRILLTAAICLAAPLAGCDQINAWLHPKPKDNSFLVVDAPPPKAIVALYPGQDQISVQARAGDCATADRCHIWQDGKWMPLPADASKSLPLLAVTQPAEGSYSDALWRKVGNDRAVLVNSQAGAGNFDVGKFDGLRIGLKAAGRTTYVTAYGLEGADNHLTGAQGDVIIANGTVWLLQRRPDGSAVLADLFAQWAKAQPIICLPGLALDLAGQWAGPPEKALSPDIYVSRVTDTPEHRDDDAHRQTVLATCASGPAMSKSR